MSTTQVCVTITTTITTTTIALIATSTVTLFRLYQQQQQKFSPNHQQLSWLSYETEVVKCNFFFGYSVCVCIYMCVSLCIVC